MRILDTESALSFPLTGVQLIEASAGTGKTYTIANLYLRQILAGRNVGEILVVTFTDAATDELRGRIRARLFETLEILERGRETKDSFLVALTGSLSDEERTQAVRQLRLAVRAMDEAAVFTIHGFCQRALSEFAFNSGQQFQMEVLADDSELWRQAVQDWWRRNGYPLDRVRTWYFRASLCNLEIFSNRLKSLLSPQQKRLVPKVAGDIDAVFQELCGTIPQLRELAVLWQADNKFLKRILIESDGLSRAKDCQFHPDNLASAFSVLDEWFAGNELLPPPDFFETLTPRCMEEHAKKARDPNLNHPFFARCGQIRQTLETVKRDLRTAALADAATFARQEVREAKWTAQRLSYDDLLTEMLEALKRDNGEALADAVCRQFPVAMIDEFQDTDPIQYGIFRRLYRDRYGCGLVMIGDPKQAIYSFRGGDIFTYMQAKQDVGPNGLYTLDTNWRSTPEVVDAVNTLFLNRWTDAFVYGTEIPFLPTRVAKKAHCYLSRDNLRQSALTLWTLPVKLNNAGKETPYSKDNARELIHAAVAGEVARLIREGREGRARIGGKSLVPKDIAVLVRNGYEAASLRQVLADRGVNAVSVGHDSVFTSEEAGALEILLQAVVDPRDRDLGRQALASPPLGKTVAEIEQIMRGENDWAAWVDGLLQLHEIWRHWGFMPMFQQMLTTMEVTKVLSCAPLAERRLTNLLHLSELLQQASKAHAGMDALLTWYRQQRRKPSSEEVELRLESDADLVQIVTVHSSKGLEYPVVFAPYLWDCKRRDPKKNLWDCNPGSLEGGLVEFHQGRTACLDAGSDALEYHLLLEERERLAEDLRLAYVALTRAESALYLVWGRIGARSGHAGQTALAYLLHPHQASARFESERPNAFEDLAQLQPDLVKLAQAAKGVISLAPLPDAPSAQTLDSDETLPKLNAQSFSGRIANDWCVNSFTALTRGVHQGLAASRDELEEDVALRFPAGSQVGSYLHLLLERLDFQGDVEAQVLEQSARIAARFDLDHERWGADAATILARVTRTSLDDLGLNLAQLAPRQRLNELEFDFATGPVDIGALNRLLKRAAGQPLPPLEIETFRGMVNGIIDLVFEHDGRFYIADYKSNFLGPRFEDYDAQHLRTAVYERRYDLQYLLYTLALHRYLRQRLPDYDYERHFGCVYYLFLRAIRPETGPRFGVYFDRPESASVVALDEQIFNHDFAGAA